MTDQGGLLMVFTTEWRDWPSFSHIAPMECTCGSTSYEYRRRGSTFAYRCKACGDVDLERVTFPGEDT